MTLLITPITKKACDIQLFCFPHAGGGASTYHSWSKLAPEWLEISAVQLPGHETRLCEPLVNHWPTLVNNISEQLNTHITKPFAFFGHSMGALIALEVARDLSLKGKSTPYCLFFSGRNSPTAQSPLPHISHEPDDSFLDKISQRYGMLPNEVVIHKELRDIFLPILRNDISLVENYNHKTEVQLHIPLFIYYGNEDRLISKEMLADWKDITQGRVTQREFPDGHFYLETQREHVLNNLFTDLFASIPPI